MVDGADTLSAESLALKRGCCCADSAPAKASQKTVRKSTTTTVMIVDRNSEVLSVGSMLSLSQEIRTHIEGSSFPKLRAQTRCRSRCSDRTQNSAGPLIVVAPVEPRMSPPLCSLTPQGDTSSPYSHAHYGRDLHHGCYRHRSCEHCSDTVPTSPRLGIEGVMVALAWQLFCFGTVCGGMYAESGLL